MNLLDSPVTTGVIGLLAGVITSKLNNAKGRNDNISEERKAMIEQYGNPFEKLNEAMDAKIRLSDELIDIKSKLELANYDLKIAHTTIEELNTELDKLRRELIVANNNIKELLQKIKELEA